jgi:hypothetical protein
MEPPSANQVGVLSLFGLQPDDAMAHHGTPAAKQGFDVTKLVLAAMNDSAQRGRFAVSFVPFLFGSARTSRTMGNNRAGAAQRGVGDVSSCHSSPSA